MHEKPDSGSLTANYLVLGGTAGPHFVSAAATLTYFVATRNDVLNFKSHGVCYIIHSFLEHEEMEWETLGVLKRHAKTRKTWIFNCVNPCLGDSKSDAFVNPMMTGGVAAPYH